MVSYERVSLGYSGQLQQQPVPFLSHHNSFESGKEIPASSLLELSEQRGSTGWYPKSIVLISLWVAYVIGLIILLEKAAAAAPRNVDQPWVYSVLPGLMLTLFDQAHLAITAMHLSRIGVSALHSSRTAPRSWMELFWLADGDWQGPIGIGTAIISAFKYKVGISLTFAVFAITCMISLITPVILSRAYPVETLDVLVNTTITPSTFSPQAFIEVDSYAEVGTGSGSWATGLSIFESYNESVYIPPGRAWGDASDFFFAGATQGADTRIPGLRLQGGCQPYHNDSLPSFLNETEWETFCTGVMNSSSPVFSTANPHPWSVNLTVNACADIDYAFPRTDVAVSTNTAYFYFVSTNGTDGPVTVSVVKCQSELSLGDAAISGINGTYTDFNVFYQSVLSGAQGGEPLEDPLAAVARAINPDGVTSDTSQSILVKQLGYNATSDGQGGLNFTQPTTDIFADRIWLGVSHMTAGLGLLARTADKEYPAITHHKVSGRTRSPLFTAVSFALLGSWLFILLLLTAYSYRKTFASSLNSYVAAQLSAKALVNFSDEHAEDRRLRTRFSWTGMSG